MISKNLLKEYTKFDYLNQDRSRILIKILVGYIKPSFLFKSEILTPIHLGRAVAKENSKDGIISNGDLRWLYENCIGDDDFEGNISNINRRVGFLTGTWWAYNNYEKLGNPEYFGSFGYRRLLNPCFLNKLRDYDIILPKQRNFNLVTIREQFIDYHGESLYQNMIAILKKNYPQEEIKFQEYLNRTSGYFDEIYIMKRELFFSFCEWIFPILFVLLKDIVINSINNDSRDIAFIIERLTGYYCYQVIQENKKYFETETVITEKMIVNNKNLDKTMLLRFKNKKKGGKNDC